jgi:hypothetical protein
MMVPVSTFLSAATLADSLGLAPSATKSAPYTTSGTTASQSANLSNAITNATATASPAAPAKTNAQDAAASNSRGGQNNQDGTQHALQADPSQVAGAVVKGGDNTASQTISFAPVVAGHETAVPHTNSGTAGDSTHTATEAAHFASDASGTAIANTSSAINSARVIQSMSETEMRVGMRSSEFGDISIRTMVSQQQVQAQISVDHSELSNAISAHIPSIQAKFGSDLGLHATIEVNQSGMSFSGERGQSTPREQRNFVPTIQAGNTGLPTETEIFAPRTNLPAADDSRLDIRA